MLSGLTIRRLPYLRSLPKSLGKLCIIRLCSSESGKLSKVAVVRPSISFTKPKPDAKDLSEIEKQKMNRELILKLANSKKEEVLAELQSQLDDENILKSEKEFIKWQIQNFDKLKTADVGFLIGRRYQYYDRRYHPLERMAKILKNSFQDMPYDLKGRLELFKDQINSLQKPLYMYQNATKKIFSEHADFCIIGGGMMGMSYAFNIITRFHEDTRVVLIEKDLSYSNSSTASYTGEMCYEFQDETELKMMEFAALHLQRGKTLLEEEDHAPVNLDVTTNGHLTLASADRVPELLESFSCQRYHGVHVKILNKKRLYERFPWLKTEGIEAGLYCVQKAGWYEPFNVLSSFARKAKLRGLEIVHGEVIGATTETSNSILSEDDLGDFKFKRLHRVQVRLPDGVVKTVDAAQFLLAAGHQSREVGKLLGVGSGRGPYRVQIPVEKKTQRLFSFYAPNGPCLLMPFLKDDSGVFVRRDGLTDLYVCGRNYPKGQGPDPNLSVEEYFYKEIHPILAQRVKAFEHVKPQTSWIRTSCENTFDGKPLLGRHPTLSALIVACGFSDMAPHMSIPAANHLVDDFLTGKHLIDLERYDFARVFKRNFKPKYLTVANEGLY